MFYRGIELLRIVLINQVKFLFGIVVFVLMQLPFISFCQHHLTFTNYQAKDGLSHSLVDCITQDNLGFIWIATEDGLNRFDGYKFEIFRSNSNDLYSIYDNTITHLFADNKGYLWIGFKNGGINRYDPLTEKFIFYPSSPSDTTGISNNRVTLNVYRTKTTGFIQDSDSNVWIGTNGGLNVYNHQTNKFTRYQHDPLNTQSISSDTVTVMYFDKAGDLWVGTSKGLNKFDKTNKTFKRYLNDKNNPNSLSQNFITAISEDATGQIWVGTRTGGLNILSVDKNSVHPSFKHYYKDEQIAEFDRINRVLNIYQSRNGDMWIGFQKGIARCRREQVANPAFEFITEWSEKEVELDIPIQEDKKGNIYFGSSAGNGLTRYNYHSQQKTVFKHNFFDPSSISRNLIRDIFIDRNEILWVATTKGGVCKADLNQKPFNKITNHISEKIKLTSNDVYSIYHDEAKDILWIGTLDGLNGLQRKTSILQRFHYVPGDNKALAGRIVGVIEPDPKGFLWLGYFDYKISWFNPKDGTFRHFDHSQFPGWSLRDIYTDDNQTIWFGQTIGGLLKYYDNQDQVVAEISADAKDQLNDDWINAIYNDNNGNIWIGTQKGGLNRYNHNTKEIKHYVFERGNIRTIASNQVQCLYQSKHFSPEFLWIGTNNGLSRLNVKNEEIKNYTLRDGLPNNTIQSILEDTKGNLWLSTNKGISKFNPESELFKNFDQLHGLPTDEFNIKSAFKNSKGEMFFGSVNGLVSFFPDSIVDNPYKPPVLITQLLVNRKEVKVGKEINGQVILTQAIFATPSIILNHLNNDLTIGFTAIHYSIPSKNKYLYMLEGFDSNWQSPMSNYRYANYQNLTPGKYVFKVKAANYDGLWNEDAAKIEIIILPPWWKTAWFKTFLVLILIVLVFIFYKIKTYHLKHQKKQLEVEIDKRTRELNQNYLILENKNKKLEEQKREIQNMADLLHEADQMKLLFFINISHEFRTPLTLILGPAEELASLQLPSPANENVGLIQRNARRLLRLVNQLLDLRKLQTGNMEIHKTEGDIISYIKKIFESFSYLAERHNIHYTFKADEQYMIAWFDPDKMEKILYNILSNAFKYTPDEGKISVEVSMENIKNENGSPHKSNINKINIAITDSGIGIPEDKMPLIYDRFYRIERSTNRSQNGTGIGLAITKEMVYLLDGTIQVRSKEGEGSTFIITLPLTCGSREKLKVEDQSINLEEGYPHITHNVTCEDFQHLQADGSNNINDELPILLIIDDNPDLLHFLTINLRDQYNIIGGSTGAKGLEYAFEYLPDVIISDVMMPELNGLELCKILKTDVRTSHVPIILLTAKAEAEQQISGLETGADDYIIKPFNINILKARIKNLIEGRRKLRNTFSSSEEANPQMVYSNQTDRLFFEKLVAIIEENISETNLDGKLIAERIGMSKSTLYRKLKMTVGDSVNLFIRNVRLKKGAELLLSDSGLKVSEIAYQLGFSDPAYFTKCFTQFFGISPTEYRNR